VGLTPTRITLYIGVLQPYTSLHSLPKSDFSNFPLEHLPKRRKYGTNVLVMISVIFHLFTSRSQSFKPNAKKINYSKINLDLADGPQTVVACTHPVLYTSVDVCFQSV